MSIKSFQDTLRVPISGKIRLGTRTEKGGRADVPANLDYFNVSEVEDVRNSIYGEKPKELHVLFHSNSIEDIAPYSFQWWTGGHKDNKTGKYTGGELQCQGDGVTAIHYAAGRGPDGTFPIRKCLESNCPDWKTKTGYKQCGPRLNLVFSLPLVSRLKPYQLDTGSYTNIKKIISTLEWYINVCGPNFVRQPFRLWRYEDTSSYTDVHGNEKSGKQFYLGIEPYDNMREQFGGMLEEVERNYERRLLDVRFQQPATVKTMEVTGYDVRPELEAPQVDPTGVLHALADDTDVITVFDAISAAKGKAHDHHMRFMWLKKYEQSGDPKTALLEFLRSTYAEVFTNPGSGS
jgi:hypothetical protein